MKKQPTKTKNRRYSKEALLRLVFGLGNPGSQYAHSRHNVGFDAIDTIAAFLQCKLRKRFLRLYRQMTVSFDGAVPSLLVQPLTFMNRSGEIVHHFIPDHFAVEDLVVVCDNLDLPPGTIRIRKGGSSAGHNGLKSLIRELGSAEFIRVYVGIGRPQPGKTVVEHVLEVPDSVAGRESLGQGVALAAEAVMALCKGASVEEVAREFNTRNGTR